MAKIDESSLREIREEWEPRASEVAETLQSILDRSTKVKDEAHKLIKDFTNSSYALSKVTDRVINHHTMALAGLKDIHTALHKVQEISEHFRASLLPADVECLGDGKAIWDEEYSSFTGDLDVICVLLSNTDKEREQNYIYRESLTSWSYIRANSQQMESYEKYLTNQVFGFNRLDTLVQKLENIKANELFGDLNDDSVMNKNEDDKGFTDEDIEEPKVRRKRVPRKKPDNAVEDDEFESIQTDKKSRKTLGRKLKKVR